MTTRPISTVPEPPLLTADQVGAWLGYSADTVYRYAREQGLPFRRMAGNRKRFVRTEVQAWLDRRAATILPGPEIDQAVIPPQARTHGRLARATAGGGPGWAARLKEASGSQIESHQTTGGIES